MRVCVGDGEDEEDEEEDEKKQNILALASSVLIQERTWRVHTRHGRVDGLARQEGSAGASMLLKKHP